MSVTVISVALMSVTDISRMAEWDDGNRMRAGD
jgi:hypothetical protein